MYATAFQDRTLEYGSDAVAPFGAPASVGPVVGNGNIFIHMDASSSDMCEATRTRLGLSDTLGFTSIHRESPGPLPPVKSRSLHLSNGTYRAIAGTSERECEVTVLAARQAPSSCVSTVWCRSASTLVHTLRPPLGMVVSRADLVIRNFGGQVLPHMALEGSIGATRVAYCCVYAGGPFTSLDGAREPESGTSLVRSIIRTTGPNVTVSMLHTVLHGPDVTAQHAFRESAQHFRTNVDPYVSLNSVVTLHSLRWASLWNGGLSIESVSDASDEERERVRLVNIHIQTSLYRLFVDFPDPNAIATLASGDATPRRPYSIMDNLALVSIAPWLTFMQPVARPTMWMPMYELAGRITDAWDGFRVTLDRARLSLQFQTLRHHVNEMTIRIENAAPSLATGASASVGTVQTRSGALVSDDPYATGAAKRAFHSAEQICNALRYPSERSWDDLKNRLAVPRQSSFSTEIAGVSPPSTVNDGLVLLHPGLLRAYANSSDLGPYSQLIDGNAGAMTQYAQSAACPAAFASIAMLAADIVRLNTVQERGAQIDACYAWLMDRCEESVDPLWGSASHASTDTASNILACIIFGFTRVMVRGFVTRDGIHTVPSSLLPGPATTTLPRSWRVVRRRVSRTADQQSEHLTQNSR